MPGFVGAWCHGGFPRQEGHAHDNRDDSPDSVACRRHRRGGVRVGWLAAAACVCLVAAVWIRRWTLFPISESLKLTDQPFAVCLLLQWCGYFWPLPCLHTRWGARCTPCLGSGALTAGLGIPFTSRRSPYSAFTSHPGSP